MTDIVDIVDDVGTYLRILAPHARARKAGQLLGVCLREIVHLREEVQSHLGRQEAARAWLRNELDESPYGPTSCGYCGAMLSGFEEGKAHCRTCPENPLVQEVARLREFREVAGGTMTNGIHGPQNTRPDAG